MQLSKNTAIKETFMPVIWRSIKNSDLLFYYQNSKILNIGKLHLKELKKQLRNLKKNLQNEVKADEELWFIDESRFGTHSKIGHGWFKTGIRTPVKIKLGYKNLGLD